MEAVTSAALIQARGSTGASEDEPDELEQRQDGGSEEEQLAGGHARHEVTVGVRSPLLDPRSEEP